LLALGDVEVAQDFFGLVTRHRIDLALDTLGGARGLVHPPPDLLEKPVRGLGHAKSPLGYALVHRDRTMAIPKGLFKGSRRVALSYPGFLAIVLNAQKQNRNRNEENAP